MVANHQVPWIEAWRSKTEIVPHICLCWVYKKIQVAEQFQIMSYIQKFTKISNIPNITYELDFF